MRTHQVQIDDEIFQLVKANAEPLVDDFNSALRKLLLLRGSAASQIAASKPTSSSSIRDSVVPNLPKRTPVALRHVLEVAHLVRTGPYSRTEATNFVARRDGVFSQTVLDKYCRQLALTAKEFDQLLEERNSVGLQKLLKAKFPEHSEIIEKALQ